MRGDDRLLGSGTKTLAAINLVFLSYHQVRPSVFRLVAVQDKCLMTIDESILQQVVNDICSGMLGLEMERSEDFNCEDTGALSAIIRISGGWDSLVQVLTPRKTAIAIASNMFAMSKDELSEAEIRDAVGEIVNIVGGNLKGIVEGVSSLSLPCVGESDGCAPFDSSFSGVSITNLCQGDPFTVRILDRGIAVAT